MPKKRYRAYNADAPPRGWGSHDGPQVSQRSPATARRLQQHPRLGRVVGVA